MGFYFFKNSKTNFICKGVKTGDIIAHLHTRHTHPSSENGSISTFQHLLQLFICLRLSSWTEQSENRDYYGIILYFVSACVDLTYLSQVVSEYVLYSSPWSPPELRYTLSWPQQTSWTALHAGRTEWMQIMITNLSQHPGNSCTMFTFQGVGVYLYMPKYLTKLNPMKQFNMN